ncbi:MAG: toprim domain-containing protein [Pseudobacteriovorax sp.]|nr:toprim domain-containing protein [Pseudobacteriovorax sp.]
MTIDEIKQLDLWKFAERYGYFEDSKESSSDGETKMYRHDNSDKIAITRLSSGRFVWVGNRPNDERGGTIIDLLAWLEAISPSQAIREIRAGITNVSSLVKVSKQPRQKPRFDPTKIKEHIASLRSVLKSDYLQSRGIQINTYRNRRFDDRIFEDERGNIIFPHENMAGYCGYEIKNTGYTAFSAGGQKRLWSSKCFKDDDTIVFCETGIDALSYYQLFKLDRARFFSVAGRPSDETYKLAIRSVERLTNPLVILAFDNDEGGRTLTSKFNSKLQHNICRIKRHLPEKENTDWNDFVKSKMPTS